MAWGPGVTDFHVGDSRHLTELCVWVGVVGLFSEVTV